MQYILKRGYVLMLDILGFREAVSKRSYYDDEDNFFNIWKSINESITQTKDKLLNDTSEIFDIDFLCFSDTIIICISLASDLITTYEDKYLIAYLAEIINSFFQFQMIENKIFFRGAISYGEYSFSAEQNIVMGDAIDEASEWYDKVDWIGIILTPSAEYAVEMYLNIDYKYIRYKGIKKEIQEEIEEEIEEGIKNEQKTIKNSFHKYYKIPFKPGIPNICHYAYSWFDLSPDINKRREEWVVILYLFSNQKQSIKYSNKYSNTLDYVHYLLFETDDII